MRVARSIMIRGMTPALALALGGCGAATDNLPREAVSGKVAFEGEPISKGAILFRTSPGSGETMEVGSLIRDGEYEIAQAEGPVPGKYVVMITEEPERASDDKEAPGTRPKVKPSRVTAKYNTRTKLSAEVKQGEANTFNFDLKKDDGRDLAVPSVRRSRR